MECLGIDLLFYLIYFGVDQPNITKRIRGFLAAGDSPTTPTAP